MVDRMPEIDRMPEKRHSFMKSTSNPFEAGTVDIVKKIDSLVGAKLIEKDQLSDIIDNLKKFE